MLRLHWQRLGEPQGIRREKRALSIPSSLGRSRLNPWQHRSLRECHCEDSDPIPEVEEIPGQHDNHYHSALDRRTWQNCCPLHEEVIKAEEAAAEEGPGDRTCLTADDYQNVHQAMRFQILGKIYHLVAECQTQKWDGEFRKINIFYTWCRKRRFRMISGKK